MPRSDSVAQRPVLVVDLDDTLVATDLLHEKVLALLKQHPLRCLLLPIWLARGKAHLKRKLAETVEVDPACLPYREAVLNFIRKERESGRRVVLASASHQTLVARISAHLGLFDEALGSNGINLRGTRKLQAIRALLGTQEFEYVGDHSSDLPIWSECCRAIAVNPSGAIVRALSRGTVPHEIIRDGSGPFVRVLAKQLRVHQWMKNTLVFVPVIAGHQIFDVPRLQASCVAFFAFSLVASAVYVMNDLLDLEADRRHSTKRNRPFASGALPLRTGFVLLPLLLLCSVLLTTSLPQSFAVLLGIYLLTNVLYSLKLKRIMGLDVAFLAGIYTLRILAGGAATEIAVSHWLLAFSTFFFFGLALLKRYTEIARSAERQTISGRGYRKSDLTAVYGLGTASSFLSVLVMVLYLNNPQVERVYQHWERLWPIVPIFLYWISRVWILAHRDEIHDDPVIFALKDGASYLCLAVIVVLLLWASG